MTMTEHPTDHIIRRLNDVATLMRNGHAMRVPDLLTVAAQRLRDIPPPAKLPPPKRPAGRVRLALNSLAVGQQTTIPDVDSYVVHKTITRMRQRNKSVYFSVRTLPTGVLVYRRA